MSAIRFHFGEGETLQVRGMERAMMGGHVQDIALAAGGFCSTLGPSWNDREVAQIYGKFLGLSKAEIEDPRPGLASSVSMRLSGHGDDSGTFSWKGRNIRSWPLALNTAMAVGSDAICLSAKIHGTCEIHGYFNGEDRRWLAGIIEQGLQDGVFRKGYKPQHGPAECHCGDHSMGWVELIEQLRQTELHPVVMSYSVTDGFPDPPETWQPEIQDTDDDPDARFLAWYEDLSDRERFDIAFAEVKARGDNAPINRATLKHLRFRHELSLLDLRNDDIAKIEELLGIEGE